MNENGNDLNNGKGADQQPVDPHTVGKDGKPYQNAPNQQPVDPQMIGKDGKPYQNVPNQQPVDPHTVGKDGQPYQNAPNQQPVDPQMIGKDGQPYQNVPNQQPVDPQMIGKDGQPYQNAPNQQPADTQMNGQYGQQQYDPQMNGQYGQQQYDPQMNGQYGQQYQQGYFDPQMVDPYGNPYMQAEESKSKAPIIIIISSAVALVAAGLLIFFLCFYGKDKDDELDIKKTGEASSSAEQVEDTEDSEAETTEATKAVTTAPVTTATTKVTTTTTEPVSPGHNSSNHSDYFGDLPTGGKKMTVLCWTDADLNIMLPMWESDMGIDPGQVNFVCFGCGGGMASEHYDNYFLGGEDVDMFMVEADWALKYINDDSAAAPLDQLGFTEADFADQYVYTQEIGRATEGANRGKLVASSWQACPGGWCYRTDLAEKYLGVQTPADMQAKVSDWNKFQETAKAVSNASNGKTALTTTLGGIWQAFSANRTNPWVKNGTLVVDEKCDQFIELAKNMVDNGYVTTFDQWSDAWWAAGQTDETMGYFVSTWGFGDSILLRAAGGEGGSTYGKWAVCEGPSPFYWGGTWACVSPRTDNADMVASFIKYFTADKESMKNYALRSQDYVNNLTAMQEIVDSGTHTNSLLGGQDQYSVLHAAARNIDLRGLITPYDASIKSLFMDAVYDYCNGWFSSAGECKEAFKDNVAASITDIDVN